MLKILMHTNYQLQLDKPNEFNYKTLKKENKCQKRDQ